MGLFCGALAGRLLVLFAFHFLSLHKPKSFHLVSTVADRTRARCLLDGVGWKAQVPDEAEQTCPSGGRTPTQERGGARAGEKAAFKLLGEHPSASVLPPGQDQNPYV